MDERRALVAVASGIGDILRVTPLIRVLDRLGYAVDALISPDYPESAALLEGAEEIRNLYVKAGKWSSEATNRLDGLDRQHYAMAIFSIWALPLRSLVRTSKQLCFDYGLWLKKGDVGCVRQIATTLGWEGPLPLPFAVPSKRKFELAPGTIALHPGCKPDWPWKKWHGFEKLAGLIPHVVIIGTGSDLQNDNTYFRRSFRWPDHAKNLVGMLSLQDTAALLRDCAGLVSNDSGMMHLGAAMGIPVFGIFGITNPQREAMPVENMMPVSKGLACEPVCRRGAWGRRDCEHHLQCLKSLTAHEVLGRMRPNVPHFASW